MFYRAYAVYYLPKDDSVIVIRVLHGARDLDRIARQGGFSEAY